MGSHWSTMDGDPMCSKGGAAQSRLMSLQNVSEKGRASATRYLHPRTMWTSSEAGAIASVVELRVVLEPPDSILIRLFNIDFIAFACGIYTGYNKCMRSTCN